MVCDLCGAKIGFFESINVDQTGHERICVKCNRNRLEQGEEAAAALAKQAAERAARLRQAAAKVIVTTTHRVDGYIAVNYLGVESVEYVIGTGLFSEVVSDISDFFGARSKGFETKLAKAKQEAFLVLKMRAAEKGANAVVGIDLDYAEFSGNRVALILNGTLVRLAPTSKLPGSAT